MNEHRTPRSRAATSRRCIPPPDSHRGGSFAIRKQAAVVAALTKRIARARDCARGSALVGWWDQAGVDYREAMRAYDARELERRLLAQLRTDSEVLP